MPCHAGLDWGGTAHAACVIDAAGQVVARIEARHDAVGIADLLARLKRVATPAELPIAMERPSGLIVDALIAAGHPLVPIHPNIVRARRPRYRAAEAKSDPGGASMLAGILRTDGPRNARHRGCKHPQAVRILARAWIRVLWRAWQDRSPCNPEHHAAAVICAA